LQNSKVAYYEIVPTDVVRGNLYPVGKFGTIVGNFAAHIGKFGIMVGNFGALVDKFGTVVFNFGAPVDKFATMAVVRNFATPVGKFGVMVGNLDVTFFDKENILISRDANYTQHLQQCNTLIALRMHTTKKGKETKKIKDLLRYSSPSNNNTTTTKTTPEFQALQKRRLQEGKKV
jgi:hypothetical protein